MVQIPKTKKHIQKHSYVLKIVLIHFKGVNILENINISLLFAEITLLLTLFVRVPTFKSEYVPGHVSQLPYFSPTNFLLGLF